jgi:hypothetical protein
VFCLRLELRDPAPAARGPRRGVVASAVAGRTLVGMPILLRGAMHPPVVQNVREMHVGMRLEDRPRMEEFYLEVLGMRPWDTARQIPGAWGVGDPRRGVLFQYMHDPTVDPMRRRLVLGVVSLATVEERLHERTWPFERCQGWGWGDRCILTIDPTGHRLEIRESRLI